VNPSVAGPVVCAGDPEVPPLVHQSELATSYCALYVVVRPLGLTTPATVAVAPPVGEAWSVTAPALSTVNVTKVGATAAPPALMADPRAQYSAPVWSWNSVTETSCAVLSVNPRSSLSEMFGVGPEAPSLVHQVELARPYSTL